MSAIGIYNGNSQHATYARELRNEVGRSPISMTVTLADLESLAFMIAAKHQLALYHGNEVRLGEYERQMEAVALYAQEMAEVGL